LLGDDALSFRTKQSKSIGLDLKDESNAKIIKLKYFKGNIKVERMWDSFQGGIVS
jgi:hypothetical protein